MSIKWEINSVATRAYILLSKFETKKEKLIPPPRGQFLQDCKGTCLPRILALHSFSIRVRHASAKFVALAIPSVGISTQKEQEWRYATPVITPEEEVKLWQSSALSVTSPKAFYHGGQEQRALGSSNSKFVANPGDYPNCFMYIEHRTWLKESVQWPW